MRADKLPPLKEPSIVILQAGNVDSGACDPFPELIARAHEARAWDAVLDR